MPAALEVKLPEGGCAPRVPLRPTGEPIEATNGFLSQASDAHSPKATANNGVWPLSMGGRGSNGSALAWMDPIEHRATFDWLKRSAKGLWLISSCLSKATTLALDRMCLLIEIIMTAAVIAVPNFNPCPG